MQKITTGRIVNFVMPSGKARPAICVEPWGGDRVNLQVFTDGTNDGTQGNVMWATSVPFNEVPEPCVGAPEGSVQIVQLVPYTWHWPKREFVVCTGDAPKITDGPASAVR